MPYIKQAYREGLDPILSMLKNEIDRRPLKEHAGVINYCITKLLLNEKSPEERDYEYYNMVMGILSCVEHEFYLMAVSPYEDDKATANGEVYD